MAHRKWASSSDLVTDQDKNNITLTPVSQIRIIKSPRKAQNTSDDSSLDRNLVYNGSTPTSTPPERLTVSRYDKSILSPISDVDPPGSSPRKRVSYNDDLQSSLRRRSYRRAIGSGDTSGQSTIERDRSSSEKRSIAAKTPDSRRSRSEGPLIISSVDGGSPSDSGVIYQGDSSNKRLSRTLPDTRQRHSHEGRRPSPGNKSSVITDQSRTSSPDRRSPSRASSPKPSPHGTSDSLRRSSGEKEAYSSSSSPRDRKSVV